MIKTDTNIPVLVSIIKKTTEIQTKKNHKSLALSITQKRLNAFAKKKVEVNFLTPIEGGTIIDFNIPLIEEA